MENIKYDHILIRYGELSLKGKNRKDFINRLHANLKELLVNFKSLEFRKTHDRMFIELNDENHEEVANVIKNVFGISSFSLCIRIECDIEVMKEITLNMAKKSNAKTFKVFTKRTNKQFYMTSDEVNREIATNILINTDIKVNVKEPELKVNLEIKEDYTYIIYETIQGLGGYPIGSNGKALLMMSGGIDSPVAGFMTMKRGLRLTCVHFESPPYTSASARQKVVDLVKELSKYQGYIRLYIVPFTDVQVKIYEKSDESYAITIMRRMMYKIADEIAKKDKCMVISNGESVGQVASQTLESMTVIEKACDTLVTRPLFAFDKIEIINIAKKINTYEISILPFEDCCTIFTPKNPTTRPKMEKVEFYEGKFDYTELIQEAINKKETLYIDNKLEEELF